MQKEIQVEIAEQEVASPTSAKPASDRPVQPSMEFTVAAKSYRNEQLANLTPVQVIDKLYSIAILACKKNDTSLANKAITELIVGLNFDYQEISTGFYRLYRYCKDCIRQRKMNDAIVVLEGLREAWAEAFHL